MHRIGRTGRAGASGIALSFCEAEEREFLRDINKLIGKAIPVIEENPFAMQVSAPVQQTFNTRQISIQKNNIGSQQRSSERTGDRNWRGGQRSFVKR